MLKKLEYAYPSSTIGGKTGLWFITLKDDEDMLFDRNRETVFSDINKQKAIDFFESMPEKPSKYSMPY